MSDRVLYCGRGLSARKTVCSTSVPSTIFAPTCRSTVSRPGHSEWPGLETVDLQVGAKMVLGTEVEQTVFRADKPLPQYSTRSLMSGTLFDADHAEVYVGLQKEAPEGLV